MFSKVFKKNLKSKNNKQKEDKFSLTEMTEDGKKYLLRFKENQLETVETGKYPYQMGIATPLHTNNKGFPTKEENAQLLVTEQILINGFARDNIALFVGAITGDGVKEFVFYTGDPQKAEVIFEELRSEIKHHELQCNIQEDPMWEIYRIYTPKK